MKHTGERFPGNHRSVASTGNCNRRHIPASSSSCSTSRYGSGSGARPFAIDGGESGASGGAFAVALSASRFVRLACLRCQVRRPECDWSTQDRGYWSTRES
jgi:hypothetical protein